MSRKRGVPGPIYQSPRGVGDGIKADKSGARSDKNCMFIEQACWIG